MKRVSCWCFVCISIISLSACATIVNDKTQKINLMTSTGEKIEGTVGGMTFEAPGIIELTRQKSAKIFVTNNPKCNSSTMLPTSIDTMFWGNILIGGLIGSTTDYASEEMWKYQETVIIPCRS